MSFAFIFLDVDNIEQIDEFTVFFNKHLREKRKKGNIKLANCIVEKSPDPTDINWDYFG